MVTAICLGELLVDMVSEAADDSRVDDTGDVASGETALARAAGFLKAPGGAPANVAVGLRRLGVGARFIGQVGDDPFGDWLRLILKNEGVDVMHLLKSQIARTTIAFVATRLDGKKDICFYRNPGADALLAATDIRPSVFENAHIFHCGSISLSQSPAREAQMRAVKMAIERGLLISFDPNWRPSLWNDPKEARALMWEMMPYCDVVKIADEEWEFVTGTPDFEAGAARIRAEGPPLVIMTQGAQGASFNCKTVSGETSSGTPAVDGIVSGHVPGFPVQSIDALGAGDAFVAGMLCRLSEFRLFRDAWNEVDLRDVVRFANACGALATQTRGAIPGLPTRAQVDAFLIQNAA